MPRDCFAGRNETFRVRVVSHWNHYERRINDFEELFVFKDLTAFSFRVFSWGCHLPKKGSLRDGLPPYCAFGSDPLGEGRTLRAGALRKLSHASRRGARLAIMRRSGGKIENPPQRTKRAVGRGKIQQDLNWEPGLSRNPT